MARTGFIWHKTVSRSCEEDKGFS